MKDKDPLATSGLPGLNRSHDDKSASGAFAVDKGQQGDEKILILVVDDSADNVAMISLDLQQQGYRVVTASNGEEAISVAAQTRPNLILMDISMPTLDGLGATRRIREDATLRDVPVIAVTAFGTEGFQRAAYDVGVSGWVTKPINLDRMHQLIARLLSPGGSGKLSGQL
jgi:two-component system, cell cycle response regulator DivK